MTHDPPSFLLLTFGSDRSDAEASTVFQWKPFYWKNRLSSHSSHDTFRILFSVLFRSCFESSVFSSIFRAISKASMCCNHIVTLFIGLLCRLIIGYPFRRDTSRHSFVVGDGCECCGVSMGLSECGMTVSRELGLLPDCVNSIRFLASSLQGSLQFWNPKTCKS